jgi:hypothetical protein
MKSPFKTPVVIQESSNEGVGLLMKEVPGQVICEFDQTPQMREHAEFIALAVNKFIETNSDLCMTIIALGDVRDRELALKRQQEIIADFSFSMGHLWRPLHIDTCQKIMDHVEGSFGLHQRVIEWAKEFDTYWEALPEEDDRRHDFLGETDAFFTKKFEALKAEAGV